MLKASALFLCLFASAATLQARADSVALLPAKGGDRPEDDTQLTAELRAGITALGHTLAPDADVAAAMEDPTFKSRTPDALAVGAVFAPRKARWLASIFAAVALADVCQQGYAVLKKAS